MNLSPAQKKVIERLGDGEMLTCSYYLGLSRWSNDDAGPKLNTMRVLLKQGLVEPDARDFVTTYTLTPKGQQLYEDMKKK